MPITFRDRTASPAKHGFTLDIYGPGGPGMQRLKALIDCVDYPGLDLAHLVARGRNSRKG